jgi:peptide/nickel transport system substrate-binding protein
MQNYLSLFYSKTSPDGPNYTHFKKWEFDRLYDQAFKETNDQKTFYFVQKMDQIIIDEAPIIPLFYDKVARFTRKR